MHLGDEDHSDGLVQRGAVHVDGGAKGQHKLYNAVVAAGSLCALHRHLRVANGQFSNSNPYPAGSGYDTRSAVDTSGFHTDNAAVSNAFVPVLGRPLITRKAVKMLKKDVKEQERSAGCRGPAGRMLHSRDVDNTGDVIQSEGRTGRDAEDELVPKAMTRACRRAYVFEGRTINWYVPFAIWIVSGHSKSQAALKPVLSI